MSKLERRLRCLVLDFIWSNTPLAAWNWQRRMGAYVSAGGVRFWEHDVRATAGTEAEDAHGIEEARKLLGHSEQSTTRIYTGRRKVVAVLPNRRK